MSRTITLEIPDAGPMVAPRPEWVRIPQPGTRCPHTSLSRDAYYRLGKDGKLKTRKMNEVVLVHLPTLMSVIEGMAEAEAFARKGGGHE